MRDMLIDPLIRIEPLDTLSLPGLLAALASDNVRGYPGLRAHQEDAWHATLCQIAGYVLNLAGRTDVPTVANDWRLLLTASTERFSTAWDLIAPCGEPAFLQPPAVTVADWDVLRNPIALDAQLPVKEFDVKVGPLSNHIPIDLWLFALVTSQTLSASNSPHYPQTSRMNGGLSSRLFVGLGGTPGARFGRDVRVLLSERNRVLDASPGYAAAGGIAFTWLEPWTGAPIPKGRLDPLYVDTPRRVRLAEDFALTTASAGLRTIGKAALGKGLTGDPWAPVDGTRACTLSVSNLSYRTTAHILTGAGGILPSLMQIIRPDDPDPVRLRLSVLTGGQPGRTNGHHIRVVPVPSGVRGLLAERDPRLAVAAQERIDILGRVERAIRLAIATGWRAGRALKVKRDSRGRSDLSVAEPYVAAWILDENAIFFPDLWSEVVAHDPSSVRNCWVHRLAGSTGPTVAAIGINAVVPETDARWKARALAMDAYWRGVRKLRSEFFELDASEEAA